MFIAKIRTFVYGSSILRGVELATIQKKKQYTLTTVDYDILKLIHEYHFLTVSQVTRLRYSSGSETTAQDRLKKILYDNGYLDRVQLPHGGTGNTEYLYTLSTKGQRELQALGISNFSRFRPSDSQTLKLPHLQHLISLNDFLIAARLFPRFHPDITLVAMKHDLDMKRAPMRITIDRQTVTLVPDGFLDFRLRISNKSYAMPIWVELDRGTEWGKTLQKKLRCIITAVATHAYDDMFGVTNITIAVATTEGEKRRDLMRSFVQQELTTMGLTHLANLFLFAALPLDLDPQTVFLSPIWYTPNIAPPMPLLDMSEE